ncbi:hypothetical protein BCR41DRAFT_391835 [Lobosporangium transversale]|uniref:Uncharacterized protein n=1 Tax=Lobosporangium transversale TaxID=64571 RepID=A0A1Y2H1D0_9FUNG|nr:hypothetical protein BCR41DRAFT_391835 [Lobosporangium transversale]ORZ28359.1 hypothetical protein BCR41DRAFT_391835 [Lobosporangium transversale]|eukprot:XP_021886044.1 hypothetical protein BCR41DRAFT_391835 [Lobosporangium transversale]
MKYISIIPDFLTLKWLRSANRTGEELIQALLRMPQPVTTGTPTYLENPSDDELKAALQRDEALALPAVPSVQPGVIRELQNKDSSCLANFKEFDFCYTNEAVYAINEANLTRRFAERRKNELDWLATFANGPGKLHRDFATWLSQEINQRTPVHCMMFNQEEFDNSHSHIEKDYWTAAYLDLPQYRAYVGDFCCRSEKYVAETLVAWLAPLSVDKERWRQAHENMGSFQVRKCRKRDSCGIHAAIAIEQVVNPYATWGNYVNTVYQRIRFSRLLTGNLKVNMDFIANAFKKQVPEGPNEPTQIALFEKELQAIYLDNRNDVDVFDQVLASARKGKRNIRKLPLKDEAQDSAVPVLKKRCIVVESDDDIAFIGSNGPLSSKTQDEPGTDTVFVEHKAANNHLKRRRTKRSN